MFHNKMSLLAMSRSPYQYQDFNEQMMQPVGMS